MAELSAPLTRQLSDALECIVTMRRATDDRSTTLSIVVTTTWEPDELTAADRDLLARHVLGEPDDDGWLSAQVATLHGNLFDLSEPDVLDQADEISALALAIVAQLHQDCHDGDTVLAIETVDWFPPFDSAALTDASLRLIDDAIWPLCDRLAYLLGSPLRLVQPGESEPPELERPRRWWLARGWHDVGDDVLVRPCSR